MFSWPRTELRPAGSDPQCSFAWIIASVSRGGIFRKALINTLSTFPWTLGDGNHWPTLYGDVCHSVCYLRVWSVPKTHSCEEPANICPDPQTKALSQNTTMLLSKRNILILNPEPNVSIENGWKSPLYVKPCRVHNPSSSSSLCFEWSLLTQCYFSIPERLL